jgi:hypothetical protein
VPDEVAALALGLGLGLGLRLGLGLGPDWARGGYVTVVLVEKQQIVLLQTGGVSFSFRRRASA